MAKKKASARNKNKRTTQRSAPQRSAQPKSSSQTKSTPPRKQPSHLRSTPRKNTAMLWGGGALLVAVLAVGAILLGNQNNSQAAEALPTEISVDEAYQMYQDEAFVLDVRTQEEWDEYHAPGTTLIPLDELPDRVGELPRDEEIVVVCRSGNRSQEGRDILLDAGFEQVTSMSGGLSAWRDAGYPVEGENQ